MFWKNKIKLVTLFIILFGVYYVMFGNSNRIKSNLTASAESNEMESVSSEFVTNYTQSVEPSTYFVSDNGNNQVKRGSNNTLVLSESIVTVAIGGNTPVSYDTFTDAWRAAQEAQANAAVITLQSHIEVTKELSKINNTVSNITLDLNGYTLTLYSAISISGGQFTLKDSTPTREGNMVKIPGSTETVSIQGGILTCKNGHAITMDGGTFTMNGGTIAGCDVTSDTDALGGGVYVGSIIWNSGYVYSRATFVMNNGAILYNKAKYGGGVRINDHAKFTMYGGEISHNIAEVDGGGLCVYNADRIELSKGRISYNSSLAGGGIYLEGNKCSYSVGMIDIICNVAQKDMNIGYSGNGGGIYMDGCVVTIMDSNITFNTAMSNGGGVYVKQDSSLAIKSGSVILDNETSKENNNVYLEEGTKIDLENLPTGAQIGIYNTGVVATYNDTIDLSAIIPDQEGYAVLNNEKTKEISIIKVVAEVTIGDVPTPYASFAEAWAAANSSSSEAVVKLLDDIEIETIATVKKGQTIKLDLNNHVLKYIGTASNTPVIYITDGTFTLEDNATSKTKREISIPNADEKVTVEGGVITGGTGAGVDGYGTFTLNSGNIAGNISHGVHLGNNTGECFIKMNNGTIAGNSDSGVWVGSRCTFIMTGGLIKNNRATDGGGVYNAGTLFEMSGGTISYNTASTEGGGVYNSKTFSMNGGTISYNTASTEGGGVHNAGTLFQMNGGTISYNTAKYGGGVRNNLSDFQMGGGTISYNEVTNSGGGVYASGTFKISGAPSIINNTGPNESKSNVYLYNIFILIEGELIKDGNKAQIGITNTKKIAEGFSEGYGKPSDYFISDYTNYCAYLNGNAVEIKEHSGGTATCTEKAVCDNCGAEYGYALGHLFDGIGVTKKPNQTEYYAFDTFNVEGMEVSRHCQRCNKYIDKITNYTISYENNAIYLSASHSKVIISSTVNGKKYSTEQEISVLPIATEVMWEYSLDGIHWQSITNDSSFLYDGIDKKVNIRAKFKAANKDQNSAISNGYYYVLGTSENLLVDESSTGAILNAKKYHLSLNNEAFGEYKFEKNLADITIKPIEIDLSDENNFYWVLPQYNSALRDGYLDEHYKYFSQSGDDRTYYKRSIVRNRNEEVTIAIHGKRSVDVLGNDGLYTITDYTGNTGSIAGKYTATATLILKNNVNYKFIMKTIIDEDRHMMVSINDDGSVNISKEWYIASIDNGLLSQNGDSYGNEWTFTGWTFGNYQEQYAPRLEHGDAGKYNGQYSFEENDNKVIFELYKNILIDGKYTNVLIGEPFNRYAFADYINNSIPAGSYNLKVIVQDYTSIGEHIHWWNGESHDATSSGIYFEGFTREFIFQVQNANLTFTNENEIKSKTFNYTYDGNLHLYATTFVPTVETLYVLAKDRLGIWKNEKYNEYYTQAEIKFNLARWETNSYLDITELGQIKSSKQSPREADTYVIKYKLSASNYNDYGGENSFIVDIAKAKINVPKNQTYEYDGKAYEFKVDKDALYTVTGRAQTEVNVEGYDIILKIKDFVNYEWESGNETTVVKLKITPHIHTMTFSEAIPATCTESGIKEYWHCEKCNKNFSDEKGENQILLADHIIPALGHDLTHFEAKPASCTEKGWCAYETCSQCDYSTYEEIEAIGHTEVVDEAIPATCTEKGKTEGKHCSVCHIVLTAQNEIPALGHQFGEWIVTKQATIEDYGQEQRVCSHDSTHIETNQLPKRLAQLIEPDKNGGQIDEVIISIPNGFDHNIELVVKEINSDQNIKYDEIASNLNGKIELIYDISLLANGVEIQPEGTLTIRVRIPESLKGKAFKVIHLYHQELIEMEYELDDNYVELKTDHLSEFMFVELLASKTQNAVWLIFIILLSVIIVGEVGYIVYKKFYKNKMVVNKQ